ncbi:MAG TPA: DUF58 domain-containing protein [Myxococcota bacterium]|nr:DUF58 domain-containing protein [Myxococcota bacterium]
MRVWPARPLLVSLAVWTGVAAFAVLTPFLVPALLGCLVILAALVAWDLWLLGRRPALELERIVPARAFVGQEARIELRLRSVAKVPVKLDVQDELPRDVSQTEPRFGDVIAAPGEVTTIHYTLRPASRGDRPLGAAVSFERSPLGLLRRRRFAGAGQLLRVYPDTSRFLMKVALNPQRMRVALGIKPSRRRGEGMDFESLRDYVSGDDPRRLDWAASARRGRPVVRLHQHERNHTVVVALDSSRLMAGRSEGRTKLDHAIDATLCLAFAGLVSGDRIGVVVFDREIRAHLAPRAHRQAIGAFTDVLRPLQPRMVEPDYAALVRDLAVRQRQRALVVVITDFVEAESSGVPAPLSVLARRHRVLVVAVRDPIFDTLDAEDRAGDSGGSFALHRRLVLDDLLHERETTLALLRRQGVLTLDLPPRRLVTPVLNHYLAIRYGADP